MSISKISIARATTLFVSLSLITLVSTGCDKIRLRTQVKKIMSSTIVLPKNTICIDDGEVFDMPDTLRKKAKMIVYVDSSECVPCRITKMPMYKRILTKTEPYDVPLVILLANRHFSGIPIAQYVSDIDLGIPIYVDLENSFLEANPVVPKDVRLHAFLVNRQGNPVLVGDPVFLPEIDELFGQVIRQMDK